MDFLQRRSNLNNFSLEALSRFGGLSAREKSHLVRVYSALTATVLSAAVGSIVQLYYLNLAGTVTFLATFGLLFWLIGTPAEPKNESFRFALLNGVAFVQGVNLGPLLASVIALDPSIVMIALVCSTCIFACFSLSALLAPKRSFLFLGGILSSALSMMLMMSLINLFVRSYSVAMAQVYFGLLVFCGFIVFDTQLILEKVNRFGRSDYVMDALDLFLDLLNIFVRILIILSKDKKNNKDNNSGTRRR